MTDMPDKSMNFNFEEGSWASPFVETVWRTQSEGTGTFTSLATRHWEMVVTKHNGETSLTVRGPETKAAPAPVPADAEFFGIAFKLGTFMPHLPTSELVNGGVTLPEATRRSFWLRDSAWQLPDFEDADIFVDRLVRESLLVREPIVDAALRDEPQALSLRTVQRRFLQATGLTLNAVRQIERAQKAAELLAQGVSIADTIYQLGYADQPHLNRSLKRLQGQTPAQILRKRTLE